MDNTADLPARVQHLESLVAALTSKLCDNPDDYDYVETYDYSHHPGYTDNCVACLRAKGYEIYDLPYTEHGTLYRMRKLRK